MDGVCVVFVADIDSNRKALEANRFEVRDVVLKTRTGTPAADTIEENKARRLQVVEIEDGRIAELTNGAAVRANTALIVNNAGVAAEIAGQLLR